MLTTSASEQCATKIMEVVPGVIRFIRADMRRQGQASVSLSQLRVLWFLNRCPQSSLSEVADDLDVTRPTMSAMIERLVQRGFVNRVEDPEERRRVLLTLTATGSKYLEQVSEATRSKVAGVLSPLSDTELQQLMQGIALLEKAFRDVKD
ncbi:winged helix-turn-helix transcriptional regulator [Oculatella sp. FACHB-28]|nr:winged helix-turn-helix transcriptional regulator [Oculatella sp. FACHB-28]